MVSDEQKPTLLLIDGHSLAFRAFYALSPDAFRTSEGQHTNAVHGFISMLLNILQNEKPTHLAVAFDLSRESFRTELYPEYKGTRGETPPEFNGQTELLQEALDAMNIITLTRVGYEADDILASLADQGAAAGYRVFVVSGDRDTFQLIGENTTVLYPVKGVMNLARMDDAAVLEKYGVHARQYPDLAALVGETSDNLTGIPGVGPKTAAKWLQEYGSLQAILESASEISGKVGESLREHRALAERNRRLNHLVRDLDFDAGLDAFRLGPVDENLVKTVFGRLQFRTLTERVLRLRGTNGSQTNGLSATRPATQSGGNDSTSGSPAAATAEPGPVSGELAESLASPASSPRVEIPDSIATTAIAERLGHTSSADEIAICAELSGVSLLALGLAGRGWRGKLGVADLAGISDWLSDASKPKVAFDAKGIERALIEQGLALAGVVSDPKLAGYLIDPLQRDYSLRGVLERHLGIALGQSAGDELFDSESQVDLEAAHLFALRSKLEGELEEQEQLRVYREIELPSSSVLARMESIGISADVALLAKLQEDLSREVSEIAEQAFAILGHEVNLASPKQLQSVLFEELGMAQTRAVKTGFTTNAEALQTLFEQTEHPFLERLLAHRDANKMRQIVETIAKSVGSDGRLHTSYSQTGTSTGRLSSENPNLQNIPVRGERGRQMRAAFRVGEGFDYLVSADYSQIEMRIMAHLSGDAGLIEAFKAGEDLHRFVGARLFGVTPEQVTGEMRAKVKAMSYGLVYGLSEFGLARQLRISRAEAKQLMSDYFDRFGAVRDFLAQVVADAKRVGYTATSYGRRRPFYDLNSSVFQIRENARRAALNAPIQGTAADVMKLAMIAVAGELETRGLKSRILLQVHDELVLEVVEAELETVRELTVAAMANAATLSVPLEVHIGIGKNWDEAAH